MFLALANMLYFYHFLLISISLKIFIPSIKYIYQVQEQRKMGRKEETKKQSRNRRKSRKQ